GKRVGSAFGAQGASSTRPASANATVCRPINILLAWNAVNAALSSCPGAVNLYPGLMRLSWRMTMTTTDAPLPPGDTKNLDSAAAAIAKADDLESVRKAVEDAAGVSAALWVSFLFLSFYLAIAAGAVTHTDLLLENSIKLPFLGVELPL